MCSYLFLSLPIDRAAGRPVDWRLLRAAALSFAGKGGFFRSGLAIRRRARGQLLFCCVLAGRGFHQGLDDLLVGFQPVGGEFPLAAIPGVDAGRTCTHVIGTRGADRAQDTLEAKRVELGLRGFLRSVTGQIEWMPWRRNVVLERSQWQAVNFEEGLRYVLE